MKKLDFNKIGKKIIVTLLLIAVLLPPGAGIASNAEPEEEIESITAETIVPDTAESTVDLESIPETVQSVPDSQAYDAYAYVSHATIEKITDGSGPWDLSDTPGNDSSDSNGIVRTYDSVAYNPKVSVSSLSNTNYTTGDLYFSVILPMDVSRGRFDLDYMAWLSDYTIEYFREDGSVVATGKNALPNYSANTTGNGSDRGTDSYKTEVAYQRLVGKYTMKGETNSTIVIPGTQSLSIGIYISNACNGDQVQPVFNFWMDGNPDNIDKSGNALDVSITPDPVIVSAKPRYNVKITQVSESYCNILGYFDLATGTYSKTQKEGYVRGRLQGYGVSLQIYNETDNSKVTRAEKGFKGIELPQGEITYDIKWTIKDNNGNLPAIGVSPILWDYSNNTPNNAKGKLGRNLKVDGNWCYSVCANPRGDTYTGTRPDDTDDRLYKEGAVNMEGEFFYDLDSVSGLSTPTYRVTTTAYDFDLDSMRFARRYSDTGSSSTSTSENVYIGTFATNYFGVILQYQNESVTGNNAETIYLEADISNFNATSLNGTKTTSEILNNDNSCNRSVTMYVPGRITRRVAFTPADATSCVTHTGLLSKEYQPDGAVVAGGQVGAWACSVPTRAGDTEYISSDTLMKFDSRAFSINRDEELYRYKTSAYKEFERCEFFYAADPLYPDGYDSSNPEEFKRMNTATTGDFTYFRSLDELESAGFTCCGILMEMRGAKYLDRSAWRDHAFKVVFNATEEAAMIGKTACIIPFTEGWTDQQDLDNSLSWADDATNNLKKVDRTLTSYKNSVAGRISGSKVNNDPSKGYVKAEFNEGGIITGTHKGGEQYGNTISIVGYQAAISVKSDKGAYDMGYGERMADWTVKPSSAYKNAATNLNIVSADKTTDLNIKMSAENGHSFLPGSYSMGGVSLGNGSGVMVPYSFKDANGTNHTSQFKASYIYDSAGNLVVTCTNVVAGVSLPDIKVSTSIGNPGSADDVVNNQTLTLTAKINGTGDIRPCTATNGNIGSATTKVVKLNATSLFKSVDKPMAEVGETFTSTTTYLNVSKESEIEGFRLIDILPYNGDGRGTSFSGTYEIGRLTVTLPTKNAEIYIREGAPGNGADLMNWGNFDTAFTKIGQTSGGKFTVNLNKPVSGIAVKAEGIPASEKIEISCQIIPKGNNGGDIYAGNSLTLLDGSPESATLTSNIVQTVTVQRNMSGIVWVDENLDGIINDGEERLSGISVELYRKDSTRWIDAANIHGETVKAAVTDSTGTYGFSDLAEGTYKLVFRDFNGNVFDTVTEKEVSGGITSMTSKAVMQGGEVVIESTKEFQKLTLPNSSEMTTAIYTIPYMNVGAVYTPATVDLEFTKTDPSGNALKGAEFTLYECKFSHEAGQHTENCLAKEIGKVKTGKDGIVSFEGISSGEYCLVETKAPDGYQLSQGILSVTVTEESHEASAQYLADEGVLFNADTLTIVNLQSTELPNAGMFGRTEMMILLGMVAMVVPGTIIILKSRKFR